MALLIKKASELADELKEHREFLNKQLVIEDNHIGFPERSYWIHLDQIESLEHLLKWTRHLLLKRWMTKELMIKFIDMVCQEKDWTPFGV